MGALGHLPLKGQNEDPSRRPGPAFGPGSHDVGCVRINDFRMEVLRCGNYYVGCLVIDPSVSSVGIGRAAISWVQRFPTGSASDADPLSVNNGIVNGWRF